MVYEYFKFSSNSTVHVGNNTKSSIQISGKPNKNLIIIYLVCVCFFLMVSIGMSNSFFQDFGNSINKVSTTVIILIAIFAVLLVFIRSKTIFRKLEGSPKNLDIYKRELPSKLKPAHVRMLINDGLIDEFSLASTILDLIDKGYLGIKRISNTGEISNIDIFRKNGITIYRTDKPLDNLLKFEQFLIKWFIELYGDGKEVSSEQIHMKLKEPNDAVTPYEMFEQFQALVIISFPLKKYYSTSPVSKLRIRYIIYLFLGFVLKLEFLGLFLSIYGLGSLLFCSPLYVLNQAGVDEKDHWLDLKRYLLDFSDMKNKSIEMVALWNFYLTYSIALEIESKASEELTNVFGNIFVNTSKNNYNTSTNNTSNINDIKNTIASLKKLKEESMAIIENDILEEEKKYNLYN